MDESHLDDLIRKLHDQPLERLETPDCPTFAELWAIETATGAPAPASRRSLAEPDWGGGLISRGAATPHVESCPRCQRILEIIRHEREHAAILPLHPSTVTPRLRGSKLTAYSLKLFRRSWLVRGGLAASLLLVLLLTLLIHTGEPVLAEDAIQTINRKFIYDGPFPDFDVLANPQEVRTRWAAILTDAQELGEKREVAAREAERLEDGYYPAGEVMHAWTHVYRGLRDLGYWELAIQEMHKALEYTRNTVSPSRTRMPDWHAVVLHDLGQTYAMMGDFDAAREWYERSIDARKKLYGRSDNPQVPQPGKETGYVSALAPLYWRLTDIALVENDLQAAQKALSEAERFLSDYFTAFATTAGVMFPADAELLEVYRVLPSEFANPPDSLADEDPQAALERYGIPRPEATQVVQIREHLLRVARVRRAEGDLVAAHAALDDATTIPFYPVHDESRLDFAEPFERARIAIAERDFTAALAHLQDAANHAGPFVFGGDKNADLPAIGPQLRAQLQVLRGLALLGRDPSSAEGRTAVESSWTVVQKLSEGMKPLEREAFRQQYESWHQLTQALR